MRGLAILLVLAAHLSTPGMEGAGAVGVTLFFVLSGFLITRLLLEEHERTNRISLRHFYLRRVRRLLPALLASTAVVVAVSPFLGPRWVDSSDVLAALLYYANWMSLHSATALGGLAGTWSLSVEEQFYVMWPVLLVLIARRGRRVVLLVAALAAALSLLSRLHLLAAGASPERVYFGTDVVAFALVAGAATAACREWLPSSTRARAVVPVALGLLGWPSTWSGAVVAFFALPLATIGAVLLVVGVTGASTPALLATRVLCWFGQRSYGLYLWHCPIGMLLRVEERWTWPALYAVMLPISLVLAEASYRWVELPFKKRRSEGVQSRPRSSGGAHDCEGSYQAFTVRGVRRPAGEGVVP